MVTVSQNELQALITEIDQVLQVASGSEAVEWDTPERHLLEKVRWQLSLWHRQLTTETPAALTLSRPEQDTANAIAQAVIAQMNLQRQDWLHPMQLELETLRQQRESLYRDIRHLETHQRQIAHEVLQTVMHRCSEVLKQEMRGMFEQLQRQFTSAWGAQAAGSRSPNAQQHLDWLEQLRSLEHQADQLFLSLDHTFHRVFESLEQDLQGYHQSLSLKLIELYDLQQQMLLTPADAPAHLLLAEIGETTTTVPAQVSAATSLPTDTPPAVAEEPLDLLLQIDLPMTAMATPAPAEEAWEAWDEFLFRGDQPLDPPLPPAEAVLTTPAGSAPPPIVQPPEQLTAEPTDAHAALFANLHDPATLPPLEPEPISEDQLPAIALFGDALETSTPAMPSPLPEEEATDEVAGEGPTLEETIASLSDLLEQVAEQVAEGSALESALAEDATEGAIAPGETLLATAEVDAQTAENLEQLLDLDQLQQLAQDLAHFETQAARSASASPADSPQPEPSPNRMPDPPLAAAESLGPEPPTNSSPDAEFRASSPPDEPTHDTRSPVEPAADVYTPAVDMWSTVATTAVPPDEEVIELTAETVIADGELIDQEEIEVPPAPAESDPEILEPEILETVPQHPLPVTSAPSAPHPESVVPTVEADIPAQAILGNLSELAWDEENETFGETHIRSAGLQ